MVSKLALFLVVAVAISNGDARCPLECSTVMKLDPKNYTFPSNDIDLFLKGVEVVVAIFPAFETPVQFHRTTTIASTMYNLVSAYNETVLDFFGEGRTKFLPCCNGGNQARLDTHRSVAIAYFWIHMGRFFGLQQEFEAVATGFGVPLAKFDTTSNVARPEGWAKVVSEEFLQYVQTDGWNESGETSRSFNLMPYEDTTGYCPKTGDTSRWQPLRVSNNNGAFFEQFHVTPHIGRTGRLYVLSEREFAKRKAPPPKYQYLKEVKNVIRRSANMGQSEREQAKVELYDNKFGSILPILITMGLAIESTSDGLLNFVAYILSIDVAAQEALTVVWKEKLRFDLVRPPTRIVSQLGANKVIRAYAGPGKGTKRLRAKEWLPYIGTMPHSEYPSASACLCQAAMEVGTIYNGGPDISNIRPTIQLVKGTSKVQAGLPKKTQMFRYTTTDAVVKDCANSRLTGGLHFTKATSAGQDLCKGLGDKSAAKMEKLMSGDSTGKYGDRRDKAPKARPAPTRPSGIC